MIKTTAILLEELKDYKNPQCKIRRLLESGTYTPIIRGLYETNKATPAHYLSGSIFGPSYLSFEFALAYYSLIPEAVYTCTSATFEKKKHKRYETPFGLFTFQDVPSKAFPYEVTVHEENGYTYRIATPVKAICDKLYQLSPIANQKELESILFHNLRIDEGVFFRLNWKDINKLSEKYGSRNVQLLSTYLKRRLAL